MAISTDSGKKKPGRKKGTPRTGGMRAGFKFPATLAKEAAREKVRELINPELPALIAAQVSHAKGLQYLVYRDKKTGKFERVTNIEDVDQDLNTIEVWQKDPSVQAFTDLLNRAIDRPKEQEQSIRVEGGEALIEALRQGRARAAARGKK